MNASVLPVRPEGLKPGIWLGLSEDLYFTDPALSRSDCKALLETPRTYWENSWMNPKRSEILKEPNKDMIYGSAFDTLLFTPKEFKKKFYVYPLDGHNHKGKRGISQHEYNKIYESIQVLRAGEDSQLFLTGGVPQVTIVFDYMGLRFRVRIDYFTPVANVDYKTARSLDDYILKSEFKKRGYDIQLALYLLARRVVRKMIKAGTAHVYGQCEPRLLQAFMQREMDGMAFLFQTKDWPFPFRNIIPEDDTEEVGLERLHRAIRIYEDHVKRYGADQWPAARGNTERWSMIFGSIQE